MSDNAKRVLEMRRKGRKPVEIAKELRISPGHVYGILRKQSKGRTATGVDKGIEKLAKKAGVRIPRHLNGLSKTWLKAETMMADANRMITKARRIKAAVKELDAALHS